MQHNMGIFLRYIAQIYCKRTRKMQTSLLFHAVWSALFYSLSWKYYSYSYYEYMEKVMI